MINEFRDPNTIDGSGLSKFSYSIYTPTADERTPLSNSAPIISSFRNQVVPGESYQLDGLQLNGLHEGGFYGDDGGSRTNFPVVRFTSQADGKVAYARTSNFSYRGIQPNRASNCLVHVPETLKRGVYSIEAVASGIPSAPRTVQVIGNTASQIASFSWSGV
jgi:hypothetical protein